MVETLLWKWYKKKTLKADVEAKALESLFQIHCDYLH